MPDYVKHAIAALAGAVLSVALGMPAKVADLQPVETHDRVGLLSRLRRDSGSLSAGPATLHVIRASDSRATIHVSTDSHEWLLTVGGSASITPIEVGGSIPPRPRIGDAAP